MSDDSSAAGTEGRDEGDSGTESLGRTNVPGESPESDSDLRLSKHVAERDGVDEEDDK